MTGGTKMARIINRNLARACNEFGLGMGLGSCRIILDDDTYFADFDLRDIIGDNLPFYANLGIAQLEELVERHQLQKVIDLVDKLRADGLIIHVNPMQEWLQPEGDRFKHDSLTTIKRVLDAVNFPVIVKEVGQGMGYNSLKELFKLPLQAIDFGAHGGTNFAMLELLRATPEYKELYEPLAMVGHNAEEMIHFTNRILDELMGRACCNEVIISGGIRNFLDGYYYTQKIKTTAIYGQASGFLKHAQGDYETLQRYVSMQIKGLEIAHAFLRVKTS
jgi:isopentenyl-diphosphate delta-isomerase